MGGIREVANLAGVSQATVSRVINGTAKVDPEKRERVLKAIKETGFVPNEVARCLFRKSSRQLGLLIPNLRNPYFTQFSSFVNAAASRQGYHVFLCEVGRDWEKVRSTLQMLRSLNVDGVILTVSDPRIEDFLKDYEIPVVAVDCMETARCVRASLYCDYYRGGWISMEHLKACGCRKVICIRGDQKIFSARMRYQGYRDYCLEHEIPEYILDCDYNFQAGLQMAEELLKEHPDADGIIACNDVVAVSTFKILHKKNIPVPGRIQLVGFDDIPLSELISPELTTVHQPIQEMAEQAVERLLKEDAEGEGTCILFPVHLVKRETTVCPPEPSGQEG